MSSILFFFRILLFLNLSMSFLSSKKSLRKEDLASLMINGSFKKVTERWFQQIEDPLSSSSSSATSTFLFDEEDEDGDASFPSPAFYYGVALFHTGHASEAERSFQLAVFAFENDSQSWNYLGLLAQQQSRLALARQFFRTAFSLNHSPALVRLFQVNLWGCWWKDWEFISFDLKRFAVECHHDPPRCQIDDPHYLEFAAIPPVDRKFLSELSINGSLIQPDRQFRPQCLSSSSSIPSCSSVLGQPTLSQLRDGQSRIRIGFISSDFGLHTVVTLIRGLFQYLNQTRFEVFCFSLTSEQSWWQTNITNIVPHFIRLSSLGEASTEEKARIIASYDLHVLIDLNGQTSGSGLPLLAYRPANIQITFLGSPFTSAQSSIDYYLSDAIATPPEHQQYFTEHLLLLNQCYLVNDHAQIHDNHVLMKQTLPKAVLPVMKKSKKRASFIIGTFANSQKMDPMTFHIWMNILQRFPRASLLLIEYPASDSYLPNLLAIAEYHGIPRDRIILLPLTDWFLHLYIKTTIDLLLDGRIKNTHSTGLDGLWIGIPTITIGGAATTEARAGESMAVTLDEQLGIAFSCKDYEDIASKVDNEALKIKTSTKTYDERLQLPLLVQWRRRIWRKRRKSGLFRTRQWTRKFERLMMNVVEIDFIKLQILGRNIPQAFHVFQPINPHAQR